MKKVIAYVSKKGNISPCGTFTVPYDCYNSYKLVGKFNTYGYLVDYYYIWINEDLQDKKTYRNKRVISQKLTNTSIMQEVGELLETLKFC